MKSKDLQNTEKNAMDMERELFSSKSLVTTETRSPARDAVHERSETEHKNADAVHKRVQRLEERALSGRKIGIEFERLWAALQVVSEESWKECSVVSERMNLLERGSAVAAGEQALVTAGRKEKNEDDADTTQSRAWTMNKEAELLGKRGTKEHGHLIERVTTLEGRLSQLEALTAQRKGQVRDYLVSMQNSLAEQLSEEHGRVDKMERDVQSLRRDHDLLREREEDFLTGQIASTRKPNSASGNQPTPPVRQQQGPYTGRRRPVGVINNGNGRARWNSEEENNCGSGDSFQKQNHTFCENCSPADGVEHHNLVVQLKQDMARMQTEVDLMQRQMSAMRTEGIKITESVIGTEKGIADLQTELKLGMRDLRGETEELRECVEDLHNKMSELEVKVKKRKDPPPSNSKDTDKLHAALVSCQLNSQKTREDTNAIAKKVQQEMSKMGEMREANDREWKEMKWELERQEQMVQSCLQLVDTESSGVAKQLMALWKELGTLRTVKSGHESNKNASLAASLYATDLKGTSKKERAASPSLQGQPEAQSDQRSSARRAAQGEGGTQRGGRHGEREGAALEGDVLGETLGSSGTPTRGTQEKDRGYVPGMPQTHGGSHAGPREDGGVRSEERGGGFEVEFDAETLRQARKAVEGPEEGDVLGMSRLKGRIEDIGKLLNQTRGQSQSPQRSQPHSEPGSPQTVVELSQSPHTGTLHATADKWLRGEGDGGGVGGRGRGGCVDWDKMLKGPREVGRGGRVESHRGGSLGDAQAQAPAQAQAQEQPGRQVQRRGSLSSGSLRLSSSSDEGSDEESHVPCPWLQT